MLRAMDSVLALLMFIKGNTLETMAAERQKREEKIGHLVISRGSIPVGMAKLPFSQYFMDNG